MIMSRPLPYEGGHHQPSATNWSRSKSEPPCLPLLERGGAGPNGRGRLVREPQDDLGIVVEDLVDVLGGQDRVAQIKEVLPVRLEREQDGIVAARHQVVGTEGLPGAEQRSLRAVTDDVVVEATRRRARALRQVRMLQRRLVVEALE